MATRVRRVEVVDDEMLFEFYDDRVGDDVTSVQHFDRWWKHDRRARADILDLTEEFVAASTSHGCPPTSPTCGVRPLVST